MERISVAIRVKPTSRQDASNGTQWKVVENTISLQNEFGASIKGQTFKFDKIFGTSNRNSDIYEHAKDLVLSAVSGFNGTVLAYGQTSSGKTYTMQGSSSDPGVIRLAIQDVFINIDKIEDREFLVQVSYMEIYNEEINDLLAPDNRKLQIYESIERDIVVAGLREEIADSVEQVITVLERGDAQRQFAETDMNLNSSRSHTIFRMVIESRDKSHDYKQDSDPSAQDAVRVSTLNLVDLAGSERFSKSGAEGARSKVGAHINKSLTTLGMVINKLCEGGGKQGSHIPYRDCKLTRILQSALGGNARTAIICTINPDEIHIDETRSTLQFASRAKRVTNCAQVNEILTDAALLKRQKEEIKELRGRLEGSPHTEDLKKEILHLRNDLLKYELGRERLELELQQEIIAQVERERRIKEQEQRIKSLSTLVIGGAGAIEDRKLPPKKGYRRETWCPQSTTSNTIGQGLRRINSGIDHSSVSVAIEANLQPLTTPRDITFGSSPAVESLVDDEMDPFWSNSSGMDSLSTFGGYQNVADGDLWTSLNSDTQDDAYKSTWGTTNVFPVNVDSELSFSSSEFDNTRESKQAQLPLHVKGSSKISMIQEKTKEAIATANIALLEEKTRLQDQEIKKLLGNKKDMEVELKICHQENSRLRAEAVNRRGQLLHTRAALEQGVQERLYKDEEKEVSKRSLYSLEMRIQDGHSQRFNGASCLKGDFAYVELGDNETRHRCTSCHSSTSENIRRSSMQYEVSNSGCSLKKPLNETQDTEKSEVVMHEGGHETGLTDLFKVETQTVEKNGVQTLPKHNNFFRSIDVGNKRSLVDKTDFEERKGIFESEVEKLSLSNEVLRLTKAKERLLVRDLEIALGAFTLQNGVIASICARIKKFEKKTGYEIDPDDTKLVLKESVYSIHSRHNTATRQGMNGWSIDPMASRNSVEQSNTWYQSLDDASLLSSQDPGEDICNIDLHEAYDEEPAVVLRSRSVTLDMQMTDKQRSTEMNWECLLSVQVDEHFAEELNIMRNMSEAEKQFTNELLNKVKALEARLTVAEMEIIEYKVEIEHLKINNFQTSLDTSLHSDNLELQNLRVECEIQKEEIRQLMEQVLTPDHELKRELLLRVTVERNNFLEICLKESESRLIRAKDWLEELLQLRDAETRRCQELSKVRQSAVSVNDDPREHLNEVSKSGTLNETAARKFQLLSSRGAKNRASLPTPSRKLDIIPARNQDELDQHPRGFNCRRPRPALGEAQHNLLQPCTLNDLGGYTCGDPDIRRMHTNDPSEKENQPWSQIFFTASQ